VSKNNTGSLPLRGILPVINSKEHCEKMHTYLPQNVLNYYKL